MVTVFTENNVEAEVFQSTIPVFIDFYADWCGPCKMMGPAVEELASRYEGKVKFGKINVDLDGMLSQQFKVVSIPTFLILKNGQIEDKLIGAMDLEELTLHIDKVC